MLFRSLAGGTDDMIDDEGDKDEFTLQNIHNLSEIDMESFLETISATEDIHLFGALVNVSSIMKGNLRECADALAELVWGRLDYWFMYISNSLKFYIKIIGSLPRYHSVYHHKNTPSS